MRNLFIQTYKMNMAIFSNTVIFRLRALPLIKHIIPSTLYGNEGVSAFLTIIMLLIKIGTLLIKKALYLVFIVTPILMLAFNNRNDSFLSVMILFSFFGAFSNNQLLVATKEKYYAVILMRIDGDDYAKMDFVKEMIETYISFTIALLLFGLYMKFNLFICLLLPIYIIACKTIVATLITQLYGHRLFAILENNYFSIVLYVITLVITGGIIYQGFIIPANVFIILTILLALSAIYCFKIFMQAKCFKTIYKNKLTLNNVIFNMSATMADTTKKSMRKKITYDKNFVSKKHGYEYFNELFTKRHKKILTNSAYRFAGIYLGLIVIVIFGMLFIPELKLKINELVMTRVPYFLFIMYFTNRGAIVTQAMFVNCDSSMLRYRFYRRPDVILGLFKQRLKTVISVNMIPSLTISIGLCLWLYVSGGTSNPIYYLLIFLCINAISAFFSVHYLVLYYVLQPYNINMQAKGTLYSIISLITYGACYALMNLRIATFPFTIVVIIFCIIYIFVSLAIAYKQAYKTFKIKN